MKFFKIIFYLIAIPIVFLHASLFGLLISDSPVNIFNCYILFSALLGAMVTALWLSSGLLVYKTLNVPPIRAHIAALLPLTSLWVYQVADNFARNEAFSIWNQPSTRGMAVLIFTLVLGIAVCSDGNRKSLKLKSAIYVVCLVGIIAIIVGIVNDVRMKKNIIIRKSIKGDRGLENQVAGAKKYSNLRVTIDDWSRHALALPVDHSIQNRVTVPPNGLFRAAVGVTEGEEGYQVAAFAMDRQKNKYKIGVWYITRDKNKWVDISADVGHLAGKEIILFLQVLKYNPAGGESRAGESHVYLSAPRIYSAPPKSAPNVVLVLIDTLRADHLSPYGYSLDTSPFLGEWASRSVVFDRMYSSSAWTVPAVASLFTGQMPSEHGVFDSGSYRLDKKANTIAEVLKNHGWYTAAVFGNIMTSSRSGFAQGFNEFTTYMDASDNVVLDITEWITQKGGEIMEAGAAKQPFFLYLHYNTPHEPYVHQSDSINMPGLTSRWLKPLGIIITYIGKSDVPHATHILKHHPWLTKVLSDNYDREVNVVDDHMRKIMETINRLGLGQNTIVAFISDHGEAFMEHEYILHDHILYDETIRVPFILNIPGMTSGGARIKTPVSIVDVAPTLLEALGIDPSVFPGRSLMPLIRGEEVADVPVFSELLGMMSSTVWKRAVIFENKKLIVYYTKDGTAEKELFFLDEDVGERTDRSKEFPEIVKQLERLLEEREWTPSANVPIEEMDPAVIRRLRQLGYIK